MRCNMTFLLIWHHWHWYHKMPIAPSMAPLHSWGQNKRMRCNMSFLVMWCHWHWYQCHMMWMVLSIAPLHSLGQDDWNEVEPDTLSHVMSLALASVSHNANGVINGTIAFLRSKQSKWGNMTSWSCETFSTTITCCPWHLQWHHSLGQDYWNGMQHDDFFSHVTALVAALSSHETNSVVNATISFLRSRQSNWDAT